MKFIAESSPEGKLSLRTEFNASRFRDFLKANKGIRLKIEALTPESKKQRGFYHGAVITLWAYLDGKDYRDNSILEKIHEIAKEEFNPEIFFLNGKQHRIGKSTKGKLNDGFIDTIIDYLEESYGIDRMKVLNPDLYKKYRDEIYSEGKYDTFIDYMIDLRLLK